MRQTKAQQQQAADAIAIFADAVRNVPPECAAEHIAAALVEAHGTEKAHEIAQVIGRIIWMEIPA